MGGSSVKREGIGASLTRALLLRIVELSRSLAHPVSLMEVCGTHTHAIAAAGLRRLMPSPVRLISGPGCPVCVTPITWIDRACALAACEGTTICSFGDLLRVPSSTTSLERARAHGADLRVCYSPADALDVARREPHRRVVFLAVGFETTAPTIAAALREARREHLDNFWILPGNKTIPPALDTLFQDPAVRVDGLICPGHVSVIIGSNAYLPLLERHHIPCAVAGFQANEILAAVVDLLQQILEKRPRVSNLYPRVVRPEGNPRARALLEECFRPSDAEWRGLGMIPSSGLALREEFAEHDASRIPLELPEPREPAACRCGDVLRGRLEPPSCPLYGRSCTPDHPLGACMVSSEGACAAWYRHEGLSMGTPR